LITQLIFRPDNKFGSAFSSMLADIQIKLSITQVADDALSLTFANNAGGAILLAWSGWRRQRL
jgi:hypothetical protein